MEVIGGIGSENISRGFSEEVDALVGLNSTSMLDEIGAMEVEVIGFNRCLSSLSTRFLKFSNLIWLLAS